MLEVVAQLSRCLDFDFGIWRAEVSDSSFLGFVVAWDVGGEHTRVGRAQPLDNQLNSIIRHGCDNRYGASLHE
jgi:hypothetical protein